LDAWGEEKSIFTLPEIEPLLRSVKSYSITGLDRSLGLQEVEALRISRQLAHESGMVVSPTHRPPLPLMIYPWSLFLLEAESTPEP
jgi:hypothetical protein